ncbi:hypothetical protein AVEN_261930-1 [Araneus ventricosus]|uniref:Uncharacterized protein n=1 Tax=Araneus ventricosus TaxID=182803 RepID=A0A4Y2LA49_ARAVE|nr:hypothetical protein AVEN_261930-1 [Araneus ventricosus]
MKKKFCILRPLLKLRSNGLSFYEFRPRFALFPVVGTGIIDVVRGLVSASMVSRVVAVNNSHIKGGGSGQTASESAAERFAKLRALGMARLFEFHQSQFTSTNLERLEVWTSHTPSEQGFIVSRTYSNFPHFAFFHFVVAISDSVIRLWQLSSNVFI